MLKREVLICTINQDGEPVSKIPKMEYIQEESQSCGEISEESQIIFPIQKSSLKLNFAKSSTPFECAICKESFKFRMLFALHMQTQHSNPKSKAKKMSKNSKLSCEVCQEEFDLELEKNRHINLAHNGHKADFAHKNNIENKAQWNVS